MKTHHDYKQLQLHMVLTCALQIYILYSYLLNMFIFVSLTNSASLLLFFLMKKHFKTYF